MNDTTKLTLYARLAAITAQVAQLSEDIGTGSPDASVLAGMSHLHDLGADLYALSLDALKPPGAYAFKGDAVKLDQDIAPASSHDRANQRLSTGFELLMAAELEKAS